jgi:epoxyqueuosine reductase
MLGNRIYGCDICQQVCPWNSFAWPPPGGSPLFGKVDDNVAAPRLLDLLNEELRDDATFRARFGGTAVERTGRLRLLRNACVAAGNFDDECPSSGKRAEALLTALRDVVMGEDDACVREHATWAIDQLERRYDQT